MRPGLSEVDPRLLVGGAAIAAGVLRFPGLLYPLGADEAGLTLVARGWEPAAESPYGPYWVDRPPTLLALIRLSDWVGGPYFIRIVAAVGCVVLVVLAAATARAALRFAGETDERFVRRTGAWTAVLAAGFTSTGLIDPVMAKGEILGIPFVMASFYLALRAVTRAPVDRRSVLLAAAAGVTAVLAQGMKQNLVSGLVFGSVLLVGSRLRHRITTRGFLRLGGAALGGAALPVLGTVLWALSAGVHLDALWYAVYGFRSDALAVIAADAGDEPVKRGLLLLGIALGTGVAFLLAGLLLYRRRVWRFEPTLATATALVVTVDGLSLLLGGSFWRPYLFAVLPGLVLCATLLLAVRLHVASRARMLVVATALVSASTTTVWTVVDLGELAPSGATRTGIALREVAEPGDTVVVYGGRAEIVLASGMRSPYQHLWSLPMRTLDPRLEQLRRLLIGPHAPTWLVMWVSSRAWDGMGVVLEPVIREHYRAHGLTCNGRPIYLLAGTDRPVPDPDCT